MTISKSDADTFAGLILFGIGSSLIASGVGLLFGWTFFFATSLILWGLLFTKMVFRGMMGD